MRSTPSLPAVQNSVLARLGWGRGRWMAVSSETREVEDCTGVELDDLVRLVVGHVTQRLRDLLAAVGPVAVRGRVVDLDADAGDADLGAGSSGRTGLPVCATDRYLCVVGQAVGR